VQLRAATISHAERRFAAGETDHKAVIAAQVEHLAARIHAIDAQLRMSSAGLQCMLALSATGCDGPSPPSPPQADR
jgi:outer membrane protein TolC